MVLNQTHPQADTPVALVTGASRGIGQAVAEKLAAQGYHLVLTARTEGDLNALAQKLQQQHPGIEVLVFPADIQKFETLEKLVEHALERFGRLDVLVNNAGIACKIGLLQEMSIADIDRTIDTNLKAPIYLMRLVLPHMVSQQHGTIININSVAGKTAFPYWSVYDASKFGLHAITQAVGEEQRMNHIRVVGVYPGAVETRIWDSVDLESKPNLKSMLRPENVADAVAYILQQPQEVYIPEVTLTPLQPAL